MNPTPYYRNPAIYRDGVATHAVDYTDEHVELMLIYDLKDYIENLENDSD